MCMNLTPCLAQTFCNSATRPTFHLNSQQFLWNYETTEFKSRDIYASQTTLKLIIIVANCSKHKKIQTVNLINILIIDSNFLASSAMKSEENECTATWNRLESLNAAPEGTQCSPVNISPEGVSLNGKSDWVSHL